MKVLLCEYEQDDGHACAPIREFHIREFQKIDAVLLGGWVVATPHFSGGVAAAARAAGGIVAVSAGIISAVVGARGGATRRQA